MSIINDALKRAQKKLDKQNNTASSTRSKDSDTEINSSEKDSSSAWNTTLYSLLCVFFLIVGIFSTALYYLLKQTPPNNASNIKNVQAPPQQQAKHKTIPATQQPKPNTHNGSSSNIVLNGIMTTGDKHVALINNEIYEEGETIFGMKIQAIREKEIDLLDKGILQTISVKKNK